MRGGHFVRCCPGGAARDRGLVNLSFEARLALSDEFGIGFDNPAVLDISPPILQYEVEDEFKGRTRVMWVQTVLLDHDQIEFLTADGIRQGPNYPTHRQKCPAPEGGLWGRWRIGGQRMKCSLVERGTRGQDMYVSFCSEPLNRIANEKLSRSCNAHYDNPENFGWR